MGVSLFENQTDTTETTCCQTKVNEPNRPNYLPVDGGRIMGCIPFPRLLKKCSYFYVSIFIRKAELILKRSTRKNSNDMLTEMVKRRQL